MVDTPPALRTQRILWFALTSAPFIYFGVARFVVIAPPRPPPAVMLPALGAVALSTVAMSFMLPPILFAKALRSLGGATLRTRQESLSQGAPLDGGFRDAPASAAVVEDPSRVIRLAAQADQTPLIITLALRESVAIFGLVLALLGVPIEHALPFFALSVALMVMRYPSLSSLQRRAEAVLGARIPLD